MKLVVIDGQGGGVGKLVGVANDVLFKGVAGINAGVALQPPAVGLRAEYIQWFDGPSHQAGDDVGNIVGKSVVQRIPEQLADILQPALGAVDKVFAFAGTIYPAGNAHLGVICRQPAV